MVARDHRLAEMAGLEPTPVRDARVSYGFFTRAHPTDSPPAHARSKNACAFSSSCGTPRPSKRSSPAIKQLDASPRMHATRAASYAK